MADSVVPDSPSPSLPSPALSAVSTRPDLTPSGLSAAGPAPLEPIRVQAKFFFEGERKFFMKGVTYGPFEPDAAGDFVGNPVQARKDFALIVEMGANVLRVYHIPPRWFLDLCAEFRLRVIISIPWAEHVEFLNNRKIRTQVVRTIREGVAKNKGHEAIFAYLVGNEIPFSMARWLGARRVINFVEQLINEARAVDPRPLYSYASYPPTEYLLPQNVDFYSFNVYLERRLDFEKYLARLQNLADDKPLIFGEFGLDTIRKGEEMQVDVLDWHLDCVVKGGAAGTIFFSWTDEWFTGGHLITDWAFGLVRADRTPKKAYFSLKAKLAGDAPVTAKVELERYPRVSVIVCSYNGGKTLPDCIASLEKLNYPDYEVILVDDGSKDGTLEMAQKFLEQYAPDGKAPTLEIFNDGADGTTIQSAGRLRYIRQKNMGLSFARNIGAYASTGEVVAYTDSDCMADPDWLYYLIGTLISGDYVGVGGPNISPPAVDWIQAAVSAAPGGPSHVLLTDVVAEHIPGCNMAFYRTAFDSVGGFDTEYRKAGDDVDFCWRLQNNNGAIAFSPAAIVWHYRRFTLQAFRKQQEGYGEAESMLRFKHLIFFGPTGTAKWKGQIYGTPRFTWLLNKPVIYHGVLGEGLFQSIYPTPQSEIAAYVSSIEWLVLTVFLFVLSLVFPSLGIVSYIMFGATFLVALSYMLHARLERKFDTIRARLLVTFLAFAQPLVRGWARYFTWLKFKRTPNAVISAPEKDMPRVSLRGSIAKLNFWNETGVGREKLLTEIFSMLETEDWRYSADTGWSDWDVQVYGNFWWGIKLRTVTEYHGGPKCLTRVQLIYHPVFTVYLVNVVFLALLLYREFFVADGGAINRVVEIGYALFLLALFSRAWRLKRRLADLVIVAADRCQLTRVFGQKAKPAPPVASAAKA